MTDALELLTRRNPVDEAAMPARDARAVEDLARITGEPVPPNRRPRRTSARPVRLALATSGVVGVVFLMGGLFLFRPGTDSAKPSGGLAPGEWALEATIRVQPAPGGLGLEAATRRAAEMIRARAETQHRRGVTAEAVAPGIVKLVIPWGITPGDASAYTLFPKITLVDFGSRLVADTVRDPRGVIRWLEGAERSGPPGDEWVAVSRRGVVLGGPYPTREPTFQGGRWLRPPAGVHLVQVPRAVVGSRDAGTAADLRTAHGVVVDPPVVGADDVVAVARVGPRLRLTLRAPVSVTGRSTYVIANGLLLGRVLATGGAAGEVQVVRAAQHAITPGLLAKMFAGGSLGAKLTVEATRPLGTPPARTGTPSRIVPEIRRRYARSPVTRNPRPVPRWSTALDVLITTTPAGEWRLTEVLTSRQDTPLGFLTGPHGGQTWSCVLGPAASIIRACDRTGAHVIGRAAPGVAAVEARYPSGAVRRAVVQNGWFLVLAGRGEGATIVALDKDGKVLREIPR